MVHPDGLPSGIFCTCNVILQRIPDHKSILRLHSPFFFCHAEDLHIRLDHAHTCRHDQLILCKPFIKSQCVELLNLMGKRSVGDHAHFHSGSFAFVQQLCHYPWNMKMGLILFISLLEELCLLSGKGNSQVFHSIFNSVNPVKQLRIRQLPAQTELTGCKQRLHLAV